MKLLNILALSVAVASAAQSTDPSCVVERWSEPASARIIDINFTDSHWPASWAGETGRDCPSYTDGGYVNAVIDAPAPAGSVPYPVLFHNCTFATRDCYKGFAAATAAFSRQYYLGESPAGNSAATYNNWTVAGHKEYLEDNIRMENGRPVYGEAGFVQMCRDAAATNASGQKESMHGWMEIDHIPYVDVLQWSWSSTSWGRGIKCDIRIGSGEWKPLVWMGSERQKQGWTVFSDQGYFMENKIDARDVSLRWRVWDGEDFSNPVQTDATGACPFTQAIDPMAQRQAPRVHKIKIYGEPLTADDAEFARANPIGKVGELSDLSQFGFNSGASAPDADAATVIYTVGADGDYTSIQSAIDAVPEGYRGIIHIAPGVYAEHIAVGQKSGSKKFISLIGDDPATTIITSDVSRGAGHEGNTYLDCAAVVVFSPCFYAEGITIRNTSGNVGQAEALYTAGDAHLLRNCVLSGYQDTYKANVGARGYFTECVVEGAVDFIYDGGLEWFDNCEIRSNGPGYVCAPAESSLSLTRALYPELSAESFHAGIFLDRCRFTSAGAGASSCTLGRPWKENSGAMVMRSSLGNHISAAGWTAWGGSENSASLYEYRNTSADGSAIDTSRRASFSRQATDAEVEAYFTPEFLFTAQSKTPFDFAARLAGAIAPSNFAISADGLITWDGDPEAAGYLVYRDGVLEAVCSDTRFAGNPDCEYSIRTISKHGVPSAAVRAVNGSALKAFPTAEGFGKFATGGRGGKVVTVTSLADDGSAGTLRWAFNQHKGSPITIVFAVSGDIALNSELRVNRADWTLAGQTAPGEGVVITRNKVNLGGSQNFIVRNMRFRIGRKDVAGQILAENALGAENCANYIFDHCSFGWSVEENMNTADSHFLTVQYSMVHEGLYRAGHSKGDRGYGCQWGGSPATYHHNLLAHNKSRSCRFNGARGEDHVVFIEYANNVNFNYGGNGGCYGGENTAPVSAYDGKNSVHECNFMNNYYQPGAASSRSIVVFVNASYARDGATSWAPSQWFVDGNVAKGIAGATANNWAGMTAETYRLDQIRADARITPATPWYRHTAAGPIGTYRPELYMLDNLQTAELALDEVIAKAGTVNRDKVERRLADELSRGTTTFGGCLGKTSGIIDTEDDAEGFFAYEPAAAAVDTDTDGMPDAWESAHGLNPLAADNNLTNADGYTALEVYLASLMGEEMAADFSSVASAEISSATVSYDAASATVRCSAPSLIDICDARGSVIAQVKASPEASLAWLPRGFYLLRVVSDSLTPRIVKIVR